MMMMMMMMRMFLEVKPSLTRKPFNYIAAATVMSSSSSSSSRGKRSSSSPTKRRYNHVIQCSIEKPQDKDPKDFYMETLTAVLGSEEAAKKAYIHDIGDYFGFLAAGLTPEQLDQISKQPGIFSVFENNRTMRPCRRI